MLFYREHVPVTCSALRGELKLFHERRANVRSGRDQLVNRGETIANGNLGAFLFARCGWNDVWGRVSRFITEFRATPRNKLKKIQRTVRGCRECESMTRNLRSSEPSEKKGERERGMRSLLKRISKYFGGGKNEEFRWKVSKGDASFHVYIGESRC